MHSDSSFMIGDSHLVCEDYAMNITVEGNHHIVVCDGCSSSQMTDVGARLLALSAIKTISFFEDFTRIDWLVERLAFRVKLQLKDIDIFKILPETLFDATLLVSRRIGDTIGVLAIGDGYIVASRKDGTISVTKIEYPSGYPRYLSYKMDPDREKAFLKESPNYIESMFYLREGEPPVLFGSLIHTSEFWWYRFNTYEHNWIALLSDGVNSFRNENRKDIDPLEIIREVTGFKTTSGDFVKRRLNRFRKECIQRGWTHYDDVSMAVIYTGEEQ